MSRLFFTSYEEAHEILGLSGSPESLIVSDIDGVESIKITDDIDSYNTISANSAIIQYVGYGPLKGPGHPKSNQQYYRQEPFSIAWKNQRKIAVLRRFTDWSVCFMGYYQVRNIRKRMGNEGFAYFLIELMRTNKH